METKLTKEELKTLLKEAQKAHHAYEKELEKKDEDWAGWYAEYIYSRLAATTGTEDADASSG